MPMKNLGKPSMGGVKTGFKLMSQKVARGARVQKPTVKGNIATNHPIASVRSALGGKKKKMY